MLTLSLSSVFFPIHSGSDGIARHWNFKAHAMSNDNILSYYDHDAYVKKCRVELLWERPLGVAACANGVAVPSDGRSEFVCVAYDQGRLMVKET